MLMRLSWLKKMQNYGLIIKYRKPTERFWVSSAVSTQVRTPSNCPSGALVATFARFLPINACLNDNWAQMAGGFKN